MAKQDRQSTITVTEIGDGVDIQWTFVKDKGTKLCASVSPHNTNKPKKGQSHEVEKLRN